jgi:hypothetical protein
VIATVGAITPSDVEPLFPAEGRESTHARRDADLDDALDRREAKRPAHE